MRFLLKCYYCRRRNCIRNRRKPSAARLHKPSVTKGYKLTGRGGRGSCCQNVAGAGVCSLKTCKVGTSPGLSLSGLPQYIYSQSFSWKICGIKVVQH